MAVATRRDQDRLQDILDAINAIERHASGGRARFYQDELIQVWCLRHLEVIGEAASRLSDEIRTASAAIPWREIVAMRNLLIHGYFDVDWDEVWNVVERDLAGLKANVHALLTKQPA